LVLLWMTGPRVVLDNVRAVGFGIVLIVAQEIVAIVCNTLGWRSAFPGAARAVSFPRLLGQRLAGDAVNFVTPTASLGGEIVRVRLLRERVSTTTAAASVAIAKLSQTVGQVAFVVLGLTVLALRANEAGHPALGHGIPIGVATMVVITALVLLAQRRGLFAPLLRRLAARGLPASVEQFAQRLERLEQEIAAFHKAERRRFVWSSVWFALGWAAGLIEVGLILHFLHIPPTFDRVLAIEVLSIAIDGMLFFVPAKIGTQEGGKVLIFSLLGLAPAQGLSFALLRRIRELTWAAVGLAVLSALQGRASPGRRPGEVDPDDRG
jgi:putative membrane protein